MFSIAEYRQIQEFKHSNKMMILHFMTSWCSPCKLSKKLLEAEYNAVIGRVVLLQVNCDEAEQLVIKYKIAGVPTLVVLNKNTSIHSKIVGFLPEKTKALFKQIRNE